MKISPVRPRLAVCRQNQGGDEQNQFVARHGDVATKPILQACQLGYDAVQPRLLACRQNHHVGKHVPNARQHVYYI
jgi:hypothetical protein